MDYNIAMNYVKNNEVQFEDINAVPRKVIIPKESQYSIGNNYYFAYKYNNRIVLDIPLPLSKNIIPTLKDLAKLCKLDIKNMNKQEIINQLENYIIFL